MKPQPKISLLIPFGSKDKQRKRIFKWTKKYWEHELPDAEIVVGHSHSTPFCKTEAFNNAAAKATGKILVMMDADAYIEGRVIDKCADRILEDMEHHLWYVPYRKLYRLTEELTNEILLDDPADPIRLPNPLPKEWIDGDEQRSAYGHRYGAMVMVFPREALDAVGCFDERFKGWGGEDVAFMRALDTLYGKHKTTANAVYHLWHPILGTGYLTRAWAGQERTNANNKLAMQYHRATGKPAMMRRVVEEGCLYKAEKEMTLWQLFKEIIGYIINRLI